MFGAHRYADISGNDLPDDVWSELKTEEDLAVALGQNIRSEETAEEWTGELQEQEDIEMDDDEEGNEEMEAMDEEETEMIANEDVGEVSVPSAMLPDDLLTALQEGPVEIVISSKCIVCDVLHGNLTKCFVCDSYCHPLPPCSTIDGNFVTCQLCVRSTGMQNERNLAVVQQQQQAQRMLSETAKRFKECVLGENVLVPIPEVDRGRTDFRNVLGVIMMVGPDGYTIGTQSGLLKQKYVRSQFQPTIGNHLRAIDVPPKEVSLREACGMVSLAHGQGFIRCSCKGDCSSNRCSCRREGRLCNSKCHKSLTCTNK